MKIYYQQLRKFGICVASHAPHSELFILMIFNSYFETHADTDIYKQQILTAIILKTILLRTTTTYTTHHFDCILTVQCFYTVSQVTGRASGLLKSRPTYLYLLVLLQNR